MFTLRPSSRIDKSTRFPAPRRRIQCPDAAATTRTASNGRVGTVGRLRPPRDSGRGGTEADASNAAPSLDLFISSAAGESHVVSGDVT